MLCSGSSTVVALAVVTFLSQASLSLAGVARSHGHLLNHHLHLDRRQSQQNGAPQASATVSLGDLQMLQSEYTTFHDWMNAWFDLDASVDRAAAVAQLKQEIQAYDGWINAWLDSALHSDNPAPPALPSSVPLPSSSLSSASGNNQAGSSAPAPAPALAPSTTTTSSLSPPSSTSVAIAENKHPQLSSTFSSLYIAPPSTSSAAAISVPQSSSLSPSSAPAPAPAPVSSPSPSPSAPVPSASVPVASPSASPTNPNNGGSTGSFDPSSHSNLAVYWGQTTATGSVPLSQLCQDPSVNIVILAFLTEFFGPGGFPTLNMGSGCGANSATTAMQAKGATGLLSCPDLAKQISGCQSAGKKVLLSLGGAKATTAFSSDDQATQFASTLWNLFGAGTGLDASFRPFGQVIVDGFDIDNEDHSTAYYTTFTSALRSLYSSASGSGGKQFYISAAPQCPRPDESIPLDAMKMMDFIFVQFYNNGDCDVGQPGFMPSLQAWSSDLASSSSAKVYIGAPACPSCAGRGYVDQGQMANVLSQVKAANVPNWGGVMLWDGSEAIQNTGFLAGVGKALA